MMSGNDSFPNLRLLAEMVLVAQDDLGGEHARDQAHWDAVARERHVPPADQRLLVLSPLNRARLHFAEHKLRQAYFRDVANLHNAPRIIRAAASDARSGTRFEVMDSFEGRIAPFGPDGWAIELRVKDPARFLPGATLELVDEASRLWVSDVPDVEGWVVAVWAFDDDPNRYPGRLSIRVDGVAVTQ